MDKRQIIFGLFGLNVFFTAGLVISLFVAAGESHTSGEKFSNVWNSFLYIGVCSFSFYAVFQGHDHFTWGALIFSTFIMCQVSLTSAALSGADKIGGVDGVTAFSSLYFIFGMILTVLLYVWRFEFLSVAEGAQQQGPVVPSGYDDEQATYQNA